MIKYILILLLFIQPFVGQSQGGKQNIPTDNLMKTGTDSIVQKSVIPFISDSSKVGLSIGIYKYGKIFTYNYGSTQKENQRLPLNKTIYEIGSISKTFTGTL